MNHRKLSCGFVVLLLFGSFHAFASFTGHWEGKGTARDGKGWVSHCDRISYHFDQTPDALTLIKGEILCGDLTTVYDSVTLKIKENKLFYEELEIGTIAEDLIHIFYQDPHASMAYDFKKKIVTTMEGQKNYIDYTETQSNADGSLNIEGLLAEQ